MSKRVGWIAVRDIGLEEFIAAFPALEGSEPSRSGGWTWAAVSPLGQSGVVGPRAETRLRGLGHPSLQAWTEGGALWHLAVYPLTRKLYRHVHWFRYNDVAAGREKVRRGVSLRRLINQLEDGLPEDFKYAGPLPEGPMARAMEDHLRARARALSDALAACGLKHDRAAVRDVLTGKSVTDEERLWDVGNLPRLLEAIGLGGAFPGWQDQIEAERSAAGEGRSAPGAGRKARPGDKRAKASAAPRGGEIVFEGKRSAFRCADILEVRARLNLAALFKRLYPARDPGASVNLPKAVGLVHEAMVSQGMMPLGDMACETLGDLVIRGYAREVGDVYGLTYAGTKGQFHYEFNTRFTDGSALTTSIHHGENRKALKLHHAQFPNASVEELLAHHLAAVDKRTTEKVKPAPHPMALATLAEQIDDFLMRTAA